MQICKKESAYLHNGQHGSRRWITIGTFWQHAVFIRGHGFPNAIELHWRGRFTWCQPWQFLDWDQVLWAVRRRLEMAGLRMVSIASAVQAERYVHRPLMVEVERDPIGRRRQPSLPIGAG